MHVIIDADSMQYRGGINNGIHSIRNAGFALWTGFLLSGLLPDKSKKHI